MPPPADMMELPVDPKPRRIGSAEMKGLTIVSCPHVPENTAEALRGAARGKPTLAGRIELAAGLMRDGKSITAEQYMRVLETGEMPDRIGSQPRPCFTCGKVQTVDEYNLCLDEMVSAGEFGDDRDGYVCSGCESEVREAVRAVKESKTCAKCKEPMRCSPMVLADGRRMHPGCWVKIEPTQPLGHRHHDAPHAGCHECHVKAHADLMRGVKADKIIIDDGPLDVVVGGDWAVRRAPSDYALEFSRNGDRVRIGYEVLCKAIPMAPRGVTAGLSFEAGKGIEKLPLRPVRDDSVTVLLEDLLCDDE